MNEIERELGFKIDLEDFWRRLPEIDNTYKNSSLSDSEVIISRFKEDGSKAQYFAEIGRQYGLSRQAIQQKYVRAIKKIKALLGGARCV